MFSGPFLLWLLTAGLLVGAQLSDQLLRVGQLFIIWFKKLKNSLDNYEKEEKATHKFYSEQELAN